MHVPANMLTGTILNYSTYQLIIRTSIYILEGYKYHMLVPVSITQFAGHTLLYVKASGASFVTPSDSLLQLLLGWKAFIRDSETVSS
ncbi:hypothetical protein MTR_5g098660 [Medicago truncatula]|uniref:Uncharacterized protein n=1 Tax=Medicago truncatula TaxID=3880 RepID=G7K0P4_MEDTR|nr:hypothetical protein MTR_5g098660 [Medicago truncatula]